MLNRRKVGAILLVISIFLLSGCGSKTTTTQGDKPAGQSNVELRALVWTGTKQDVLPREVIKKFTDANTNVKVTITEGNNAVMYPQMVAAQKADPNRPLFNFGYFNIDTLNKGIIDKMWMPIDKNNVPNIKNIYPEYLNKGGDGVCWGMGEVVLIYNKDKIKTPPTSWNDLFKPEYKGHVVLFDGLYYTFLPNIARMNGGDEKNIDPAFKVWSQNVGQIQSFVTSLDQMKNLFISGDAWICPFFLGQQMVWAEEGAPIAAAIPKEGIIAVPYTLQIVAGTKPEEKIAAEKIINELISPENVGRFADLSKVVPTVKGAVLPANLASNPCFSEQAVKSAIQLDWDAMAKANTDWKDRWAREIKAKMK